MSVEASRSAAPEFFDVIIVGAGPTGLTLANLLGLEGVSTLVIDRKPGTVEEPRAVSIDDESLRVMQACGLIETIGSTIVPGYGSHYLTAAGSIFLRVKPVGKPYGYPRRNAFRQPTFERQLLEGLTRFAHVSVRFNSNATMLGHDDQYVELSYEDAAGSRKVRSKFLIGCDGASSFVRKSLGYRLEGETLPERWLIVDLEQSPAERDTLVFCDFRPKRDHQLIGFTPKDLQVNLSREVRKIFKGFFIGKLFGVVAAAIQGNVDCEDHISH